jgi:hypothetical protein
MQLTLSPTAERDLVRGTEARRWQGTDADGVAVLAWLVAVQPQTTDKAVEQRFSETLNALPRPSEHGTANERAEAMIAHAALDWLNLEIGRGAKPQDLLLPFTEAMGMALAAYIQASTLPDKQVEAMSGLLKMIAIFAARTEISEEPLQ